MDRSLAIQKSQTPSTLSRGAKRAVFTPLLSDASLNSLSRKLMRRTFEAFRRGQA